jgi:hypothetical protein
MVTNDIYTYSTCWLDGGDLVVPVKSPLLPPSFPPTCFSFSFPCFLPLPSPAFQSFPPPSLRCPRGRRGRGRGRGTFFFAPSAEYRWARRARGISLVSMCVMRTCSQMTMSDDGKHVFVPVHKRAGQNRKR